MNNTEDTPFQKVAWQLIWYSLICAFGVIGNGVVMIVILISKDIDRKSSFHVALFSLALADFFVSILGLPIYFLSTDSFQKYHPIGNKGDWMCKLVTGYFLPYWFLDASVFLLVYIAIERRNTILYRNYSILETNSFRFKLLRIAAIYFLALIVQFSSAFFLVFNTERDEFGNFCRYNLTPNQSTVLKVVLFTADTLIPIVIISYCFYQITFSLKKFDTLLGTSLEQNNTDEVHDRMVRTIKTISIISVAFCICILPNQLFFVLSSVRNSIFVWNGRFSQVFVLMRFSNSFVNPFIYCFQSKEFRTYLSSMVFFNFRKQNFISTGCRDSNYKQLPDMTLK